MAWSWKSLFSSSKKKSKSNRSSSSPSSRFVEQARFGMNDRAKTEYKRLSSDVKGWGSMSESDRVRMARKPQMMEQLPHAYINNPSTPAQVAHARANPRDFDNSGPRPPGDFDNTQPVQTPITNPSVDPQLPEWQKKRKPGQRRYGGGRRGTLLTAPGGISDDALAIGKSMLGGY